MRQVRIEMITGGTFPINVYIADINGNYKTFLGTIDPGPVPPTVFYNSTIPPIFNTAPAIMLILEDSNGCEIFKILECDSGCNFEITLTVEDCIVNIILST
jgi:hypothetical protein